MSKAFWDQKLLFVFTAIRNVMPCTSFSCCENKKQFLIPKGFAHGYSVLSETAVFAYKCDEYYHPEAEAGIIYNDLSIGIDWKIPEKDAKLSEKDKLLPELKNAKINF